MQDPCPVRRRRVNVPRSGGVPARCRVSHTYVPTECWIAPEGLLGMRIVITGAGVAGLISALFLARDGHDVVLLERDATPLPADADAAFTWDRRGAAQVRHPHAFLGLLRNLLRDDLPDVLADLVAAGAQEVRWTDFAPDTLDDLTPQPGDEDLAMIACRRTTFEWVLRRAALRTDRVELRDGVKVTGLITEPDTFAAARHRRADGEPATSRRTSLSMPAAATPRSARCSATSA